MRNREAGCQIICFKHPIPLSLSNTNLHSTTQRRPMPTIVSVNIDDLDAQFVEELKGKINQSQSLFAGFQR